MAISKGKQSDMVRAMLNHALSAETIALNKDWQTFGMKVYCDVYDEALRNKLADIPKEYLNMHSMIAVKLGEKCPRLDIGAAVPGRENQHWSVQKDYGHHHEFVAEFDALEQRKKDLDGKRDVLRGQARAIIEGVSSFSRLWKVWPESYPILKDFDEGKPMPIAVVMPEVNAAFGLPVEVTK